MRKKKRHVSILNEISGIISMYFAMLYALIIVPNILSNAGISYNSAYIAVCIASAIGCFVWALFSNRPFGFCSYIGENSFLAFSAVLLMGYSYQDALGCAFWAAVVMLIISLSNFRKDIVEGIPHCIKAALPVGIGLFLSILGLMQMGVVHIPEKSPMLTLGNLTETTTLIGLLCLFIMVLLRTLRVKLNVLFGICTALLVVLFMGLIKIPHFVMPDFSNIFLQLNIKETFNIKYSALIITFFVFLLNDVVAGTEAILSHFDEGDGKDFENTLIVSSISSCIAPIFGCVSTGVYTESILAVDCGAKTRAVPIMLGILFLLSIFLMPFLAMVPGYICASVLVYIGIILTSKVGQSGFNSEDFSEFVPAFIMVALTCFTLNLAVGICSAFIAYLVLKIFTGKFSDINLVTAIFGVLSVVFFVFYPY